MFLFLLLPLLGLAVMAAGLMSFGEVERGTEGDDDLEGSEKDDIMVGYAGADLLQGFAGNDLMFGGAGHDTLSGAEGMDWLFGNSGNDQISAGPQDDVISGGAGNDTVWGEAGNDTLTGIAGFDELYGGDGADRISGIDMPQEFYNLPEVRDELRAYLSEATEGVINGENLDRLVEMSSLSGPAGVDLLSGGAGDDTIVADSGDLVSGDDGRDLFVIHMADPQTHQPVTITDFAATDQGIALVVPPASEGWTLQASEEDGDTVLRLGETVILRLEGLRPDQIDTDEIETTVLDPRDFLRTQLRFGT